MIDSIYVEIELHNPQYSIPLSAEEQSWPRYMEPDDLGVQTVTGTICILSEEEGEDEDLEIEIGNIYGNLIDCEKISDFGQSLFDVCDAHSGDLEYIYSSICDPEDFNFLNPEYGELEAKFFYLDRIYIEPEYRNMGIGSRVLQELPLLIRLAANTDVSFIVLFSQAIVKAQDGQYERVEDGDDFRKRIRIINPDDRRALISVKLNEFFTSKGFTIIPDTEIFIKLIKPCPNWK